MKSWKTTIVGALLATVIAIQPFFEPGAYDFKKLLLAGLVALLGYLAKDFDTTGTSK